jgi:DNA-binding response OmpR family regulator
MASKKILIVEDERLVAQTLAILLSQRGYDMKSVLSAEVAISTVKVWQPNLAIADIFLPGQDGVEMAIALRPEYPSLKILLFSGVPEAQVLIEQANRKGYEFEILAKPVHPNVVFERVAALLA